MKNEYAIALRVVEELIKENDENMNSEHYSVRYSAENKGIYLNQIANDLRDKICDYKKPKEPKEKYSAINFGCYADLVVFLNKQNISKENILSVTYDSDIDKIILIYVDVEK